MKIHYTFAGYKEFKDWINKYNVNTTELQEIDVVVIHEYK